MYQLHYNYVHIGHGQPHRCLLHSACALGTLLCSMVHSRIFLEAAIEDIASTVLMEVINYQLFLTHLVL